MNRREQMIKWLEETKDTYTSKNRNLYVNDNGMETCEYIPVNDSTPGCAFYRIVPDELKPLLKEVEGYYASKVLRELAEKGCDVSFSEGIDRGYFNTLQQLHDGKFYWDETGLSEKGLEYYNRMLTRINYGDYDIN